jgi:hypothetical protein
MMMSVEQSVECLAGETEVPGENLPQCCSNPGSRGGKPATNLLSYGLVDITRDANVLRSSYYLCLSGPMGLRYLLVGDSIIRLCRQCPHLQ